MLATNALIDDLLNCESEAFMWAQQIGQLPDTVLYYKQQKGETELFSKDLY